MTPRLTFWFRWLHVQLLRMVWIGLCGLVTWSFAANVWAQDPPDEGLLHEHDPFDLVTLKEDFEGSDGDTKGRDENGRAEDGDEQTGVPQEPSDDERNERESTEKPVKRVVIRVEPLELPNRRVPDPMPQSGKLRMNWIRTPATPQADPQIVLVEAYWADVVEVKLFEQLVLGQGDQFVDEGKFDEAYHVYDFLLTHYRSTPGLNKSVEEFLFKSLVAAYRAKRYDEALGLILELHRRNPQLSALRSALNRVIDKQVTKYVEKENYKAARALLRTADEQFANLPLSLSRKWKRRLQDEAFALLSDAKASADRKQYHLAQVAIREAVDIWPSLRGLREFKRELHVSFPQVIVGVTMIASGTPRPRLESWAARRSDRLLTRMLLELADYDTEGGVYRSPYGDVEQDETGLQLAIQLHTDDDSVERPTMTGYDLSQRLLALTNPLHADYRSDWNALFRHISVADIYRVDIQLYRRHIRPEALFQTRLSATADPSGDTTSEVTTGPYGVAERTPQQIRYVSKNGPNLGGKPQLRQVVERHFVDSDAALKALRNGKIDVLDRVNPWDVAALQSDEHLTVARYALPTVHVLVPNLRKPLMSNRTFRRALVYGIHRQSIVDRVIFGGKAPPGFVVLSGPFPVGVTPDDPVNYAVDKQIKPLPYEPRLALILAIAAQRELAAHKKKKEAKTGATEPDSSSAQSTPVDPSGLAGIPPLVLAHPAEPLARVACQAIREHLKILEIYIVLKEIDPTEPLTDLDNVDLRYAELAMWEPIVDARSLLGENGLTRGSTAHMGLALRRLDQARNWIDARKRLWNVHRIAHTEAAVIPLWQTLNSFAYRNELQGVGDRPIVLYQNVERWTNSLRIAEE